MFSLSLSPSVLNRPHCSLCLWIMDWKLELRFSLCVVHLSLQLFFLPLPSPLSLPPLLYTFCMFGRYRNMIVSSTLKDSYNLISIMIKTRRTTSHPQPQIHLLILSKSFKAFHSFQLQNLTSFTFLPRKLDKILNLWLFPRQIYC